MALVAAFLMLKKDAYQKQVKQAQKQLKQEERALRKVRRRGEKYEKLKERERAKAAKGR